MSEPVNDRDVQKLAAAFARVKREVPVEFDDLMVQGAERHILPPVRAATPVLTGALRSATRVQKRRGAEGGVVFRNPKRYSNTIHWGRLTNPSKASPKTPKHKNEVKGTKFVWKHISGDSRPPAFDQDLVRGVSKLMEDAIKHG